MGDGVTLTLETPGGSVTVSMDASAWDNLLAGDAHQLKLFLARLHFFALHLDPPRRFVEYLEGLD